MNFRALHVVVFAVFITYGLLWFLIPILRQRFLEQPNYRSSHSQPTPSGGGVAFVLVATVSSVVALSVNFHLASSPFALLVSPLLAFPLALVGFFDDRHNLPATWRYCVQLMTALLVILASPLILSPSAWLPLFAFLLIGVTAVINFINFADGLDGLVAGCMAVAMTACAVLLSAPWPIWALVGSSTGFLFWNWSPAKVFMGDVGSTFLGAVFAALVLQAPTWFDALALLLVATPPLADACLCVFRRLISRQRVFQAHRLHLFQRLHQAGWSHAKVSFLYIAATAVLAMALIFGGFNWVFVLAVFEILLGVWLDQREAVPFALASRN